MVVVRYDDIAQGAGNWRLCSHLVVHIFDHESAQKVQKSVDLL